MVPFCGNPLEVTRTVAGSLSHPGLQRIGLLLPMQTHSLDFLSLVSATRTFRNFKRFISFLPPSFVPSRQEMGRILTSTQTQDSTNLPFHVIEGCRFVQKSSILRVVGFIT